MNKTLKKLILVPVIAAFIIPAFSCSPGIALIQENETAFKPEQTTASISELSSILPEDELAKQKEELDRKLMEEAKSTGSSISVENTTSITAVSFADPVKPEGLCDLLILTPAEFSAQLIPLKEHKNETGITTKIISLEDIYANFEGRDEAEKVKYCLADYKKVSDIKYAMLVGDADKFPIRYTKADIDNPSIKNWGFFATDFYYASLFKADGSFDDWDSNKNGYYGELQGSVYTGPINIDNVNLDPKICVGRIPASNGQEVQNYVAKVIDYELDTSSADWINNILLIATTDYVPEAPLYMEEVIKNYLKDKKVYKLYGEGQEIDKEAAEKIKKEGLSIEKTEPINPENVCKYINSGVGFISHIGHGGSDFWYNALNITDLSSLDNSNMLPIVFTGGCGTANFATQAPHQPYFDITGFYHQGQSAGEVFNDIPPQPACIQPKNNPESLGEVSTVYVKTGFIGYIGCDTGAQPFAFALNTFFFKALSEKKETLGELWNYSIKEYYTQTKVPLKTTSPDWTAVAQFHQPWKFFLFGDPSLRINGIK